MNDQIREEQRLSEVFFKSGNQGEAELSILNQHVEALIEAVRKENEWLRKMPTRKEGYAYLGKLAGRLQIPVALTEKVITMVLNDMYAYGKLQSLMDDPFVSDIQVYGGQGTFYVKNGERFESTEAFMTDDELYHMISRKLAGTSYRFDFSNPRTDAILPDGSRLHVRGGASGWTVEDEEGRRITQDCLIASIRKPLYPFTLEDLQLLGAFSKEMLIYIEWAQRLGDNFFVGGDVGSGKSTLMAGMMGKNPPDRTSCVNEEMPELQPLGKWFARLYTRPSNAEGKGAISMHDNTVDTLRMNYDNVYIGEVRTEESGYEFLTTGLMVTHQSGATGHASRHVSAAIKRVCLMSAGTSRSLLSIGDLFCNAVRQVYVMHKTPVGKQMTEIGYILPYDLEKRAVPYIKVAEWDADTDRFIFHGVPEDMKRRAKELHSLPVQENPTIHYVHMG